MRVLRMKKIENYIVYNALVFKELSTFYDLCLYDVKKYFHN